MIFIKVDYSFFLIFLYSFQYIGVIDKPKLDSDTLTIDNVYMSGGKRFQLTEKQCTESCRSDPKHNCIAALSVNGYICWKYFASPSSTITEVFFFSSTPFFYD